MQQGHYVGGCSGVSLHIAKGVNYRVGGTRGHYVPGPEIQTPVDRGQVSVTSQRVAFTGTRTTREWLYSKMIGADSSSDDHTVLLHVSNRQKISGLTLGAQGARFQAYLALGRALSQDDPATVAQQWSMRPTVTGANNLTTTMITAKGAAEGTTDAQRYGEGAPSIRWPAPRRCFSPRMRGRS
ncbi:MAG: hypothetical protein M3O28_01995 [Actinomycetota bacterium]|nr:hypothetical protein [Actinomycetota bacterium]